MPFANLHRSVSCASWSAIGAATRSRSGCHPRCALSHPNICLASLAMCARLRSPLMQSPPPPALELEEIDFCKRSPCAKPFTPSEAAVVSMPPPPQASPPLPRPRHPAGPAAAAILIANLVSSCVECNSVKRDTSAPDLLRRLYREHRLTSAELAARLRALKSLAAGKLRPSLGKP